MIHSVKGCHRVRPEFLAAGGDDRRHCRMLKGSGKLKSAPGASSVPCLPWRRMTAECFAKRAGKACFLGRALAHTQFPGVARVVDWKPST